MGRGGGIMRKVPHMRLSARQQAVLRHVRAHIMLSAVMYVRNCL